MECKQCAAKVVRNGKSKNGIQRYYCKGCKKYGQRSYLYTACELGINEKVIALNSEGCSIRSISRILKISLVTVIKRIKSIAKVIARPFLVLKGKEYEVDEMRTYIGNK